MVLGFPKSMNIGLAVDKKNGIESKVIGEKKQSGAKFKLTQQLIDNGGFNSPARTNFKIKEAQNEWKGWGTSLKPAFEPVIVAKKPVESSIADNAMKYGVGGINIDGCRIETTDVRKGGSDVVGITNFHKGKRDIYTDGRFPANVILTYDETDKEEVCNGFPNTNSTVKYPHFYNDKNYDNSNILPNIEDKPNAPSNYDDNGNACRYFYCAKASVKDRDEGLESFEKKHIYSEDMNQGYGNNNGDNFGERIANVQRANIHPTVKPTELMQYLIRLVTPKNATILDPFMGSGSTGKAAILENLERDANYNFIGIELDKEYFPIADGRINYATTLTMNDLKVVDDNKGGKKFEIKEKQQEKELGSLFQRMM